MPGTGVTPFSRTHLDLAARLVTSEIALLRSRVPIVPNVTVDAVTTRLGNLFDKCPGVAAFQDGHMVGFLGWFTVDNFRNTGQRGTHCPVWAHATTTEGREEIYHRLYHAASQQWAHDRSQAHAITLFAYDSQAASAFFWNGFGISVVDAIRTIDASGADAVSHAGRTGVTVRRATPSDLHTVARLESEHWWHYTQPPNLMRVLAPNLDEINGTLVDEVATYWLAEVDDQPVGFLLCQPVTPGAVDLFYCETTVAISGAFVRASHRRGGIATALLDAALDSYREAGFTHCSVDFESFNPEARSFWPRTFTPTCLSVIRHPEALMASLP